MRRRQATVLGLVALLLVAGLAALLLWPRGCRDRFVDDFHAVQLPPKATHLYNVRSVGNWTVTGAPMDLYTAGDKDFPSGLAGRDRFIDFGGTSGERPAGVLAADLRLPAGRWALGFEAAGNSRAAGPASQQLVVRFGNTSMQLQLAREDAWAKYDMPEPVTLAAPGTVRVEFHLKDSGQMGPLLSKVWVCGVPSSWSAPPQAKWSAYAPPQVPPPVEPLELPSPPPAPAGPRVCAEPRLLRVDDPAANWTVEGGGASALPLQPSTNGSVAVLGADALLLPLGPGDWEATVWLAGNHRRYAVDEARLDLGNGTLRAFVEYRQEWAGYRLAGSIGNGTEGAGNGTGAGTGGGAGVPAGLRVRWTEADAVGAGEPGPLLWGASVCRYVDGAADAKRP